jgi:hypothetical protein
VLKPETLAATVAVAALLTCCSSRGGLSVRKSVPPVSTAARLDAIRRAQVWEATDIPSKNLKAGPGGHGSFAPEEPVTCTYVKKEMSGRSPKFACVIPPDDEVKVKFGRENGEVYAEVAATRLFWALGFPADHMYPVRVLCDGCPPGPDTPREDGSARVVFDPASIERKFKGWALETEPDSGWAWEELAKVDESVGGAPHAQRDALRLLAVLVQHTDNKAAQQRLVCVDEKDEKAVTKERPEGKRDEHGRCAHPVMMVNDLGQTFGRSNLFNRDAVGSVNLEQWSAAHIWSDPKSCVGELPPSQTGSLENPRISEAGRKFLADLLMQLSDAQLRDLFDVARFAERKGGASHPATIDAWVDAFKKKRGEIASLTCPS